MRRASWHGFCWLVGVAVLGVVLWWTGADPFVAGVRSLDLPTLALGAGLAVPITCACAWRWHLVARGLGVAVDPAAAVASVYRAQFLNTVLPGGVLGDVHRGVHHGRLAGDTGRGLRAVVWERTAGQVVLALVAVVVLLLLPSPVRASVPWVLGAVIVGAAGVGLGHLATGTGTRTSRASRVGRAIREDVHDGVLARAAWPGVVLASILAVVGHLATYLVAARAVGVTASVATLLPLALLVLVAAGLPTNLAGWGPREGVAAWAFGAAGLGADQGVATAVAYGAIVAVASLPGAVVLAVGRARSGVPPGSSEPTTPTAVPAEGGAHG
ncbi:MAG: lysylphosphatidylglycerol synthase transmembrane domain-containing protein [Nocardioides sp.]